MDSCLAIKVKYGDTLKRFTTHVNGASMDLKMDGLQAKVLKLFKLNPDAFLTLTYIDEDGDVVTLDDDDDLHEAAIVQHLNPLRITVQLNISGTNTTNTTVQNDNLISTSSPRVQIQPPSHISGGVAEALKPVPEPFLKLSGDMMIALSEFVKYCLESGLLSQDQNDPALSTPWISHRAMVFNVPALSDASTVFVDKCPDDNPKDNHSQSRAISLHLGIECDGCKMKSIEGPRFKSKVRFNYDLCNTCFSKMGREADYTRIDHPF